MNQRRAVHAPDRPVFPHLKERVGEDPARFIVAGGQLLADRMRGIQRVEVCRAWAEAEDRLADELDRRVDNALLGWLNRRAEVLEERGPFEARLEQRREVDPSRRTPPTFVVGDALDPDVDDEEYDAEAWERRRGDVVEQRLEAVEQPEQPQEPREAQQAQEPDDVDVPDPDDLGGHNAAIYRHVDRKGPVSLAALQGATARRGLALEAVEGLVSWLCEEGYLAEVEPETYAVTAAGGR